MPSRPPSPCRWPGCPALVHDRYCGQHQRQVYQQQDQRRGTAAERGYDSRWQRYRKAFLAKHPLCVKCEAQGIVTEATIVDHITPHKGDSKLFWNPTNHQSVCRSCHSQKTAREDGGFGNRRVWRNTDQRGATQR